MKQEHEVETTGIKVSKRSTELTDFLIETTSKIKKGNRVGEMKAKLEDLELTGKAIHSFVK